ncbi:MAG: hypothetical protein Q7R64_04310 [bacterium]|nr:hypothetical protein [bacterium]
MSTQKTADEIFSEQTSSWGEDRALYNVTPDEMSILRTAGSVPVVTNRDNGDGTYYNEVIWKEKNFASSSLTELA